MPEKKVNLSAHKMSWNSRSKLNFAQCFKQIDTYTHTIGVHSQKQKPFKIIPRGLSSGMVDDASVFCESLSSEQKFCYPSFNLSCVYFLGSPSPPLTPPQYWRFFAFYSKCFLFTCVVHHPGLSCW
jgi:hypothetical protein